MHTLDIITIIITAFFIIVGIKRGFIIEVFRLIAMIGGCIVAFLYYKDLIQFIPLGNIPVQVKAGLSFLLIYIATALICLLAGWLIKKVIHFSMLGWLDRILGALIGILKSGIIIWVICLSIASFSINRVQINFEKSYTYSYYKQLPSIFELEGLTKLRDTFKKMISPELKKPAQKK